MVSQWASGLANVYTVGAFIRLQDVLLLWEVPVDTARADAAHGVQAVGPCCVFLG
jgi:hypothetical protein